MITIVSGLPRSGTSMMMQMLAAGGMPVLADNGRQPDDDNPRGYFEYEPVRRLEQDSSWLEKAEGKAVKVVSPLLPHLPSDRDYRVIFMSRKLDEVLNSQEQMLRRRAVAVDEDSGAMQKHLTAHLSRIQKWLAAQQNMQVLECDYRSVLDQAAAEAARIAQFLQLDFDQPAMSQVVRPELHRQRGHIPASDSQKSDCRK